MELFLGEALMFCDKGGSEMTIGLKLSSITDEIGSDDFFYSFFSTVSGNLEPAGWGSRFPVLMKVLYRGELTQEWSVNALEELEVIQRLFSELPVTGIIWDFEDRKKSPPWGDFISDDIADLSSYFVTSTGRQLIPVLRECLEELRDNGGVLKVVVY